MKPVSERNLGAGRAANEVKGWKPRRQIPSRVNVERIHGPRQKYNRKDKGNKGRNWYDGE